jgi:hypothetical protein
MINDEKRILELISKDIKDVKLITSTLKKFTIVLYKNRNRITDDEIIVETGLLLIAIFVHYSKLLNLTGMMHLKSEEKIFKSALDKIDELITKNVDFLALTGKMIGGYHDQFDTVFSNSNGYSNRQLFINSVKNISKTNMEFKTLEKKWDKLILF